MTLQHCIIHHIERSVPGADVVTRFRDQPNPTTDASFSLFDQFKLNFQRRGQKQYGNFDRARTDNPLPGWLKDYRAGKSSFSRTSQRLVEQLQLNMEAHQEPFSAHIMIASEMVLEQEQFYLFWIEHIAASHVDSALDVAPSRYIDTGKLHYAARLLVDEWLQQESPKYLSVLTSRGNKILSDAFLGFTGFCSGLDLIEDTGEFLGIVDQYMETLPAEKTQDIRGKILDYCVEQDKWGAPVVFNDLSEQLDETAPTQFARFVSQQQQQPTAEIYTDRTSLRRYVRFFGRDNTMSISFSSDLYGDDVVFDEQTGSLTLKKIPKSLKQQLLNQKKARTQE